MTPCPAVLVFLVISLCGLLGGCQTPAIRETDDEMGDPSVRQANVFSSDTQAAPNATVTAELKKASKLADDDRLEAALSQINQVLETYPDHVSALLARSRVLIRMNRPGDAERPLRRVVKLEPGNLDAKLMLGYCYLDQKQWEIAERSLAEVAYSEGTVRQRISGFLGLAFVYENQGQKDLVSVCYREAIDLDESVGDILMQAERQFFWPNPVGGEEERLLRPSPSMREVKKIISEVKKTPQ